MRDLWEKLSFSFITDVYYNRSQCLSSLLLLIIKILSFSCYSLYHYLSLSSHPVTTAQQCTRNLWDRLSLSFSLLFISLDERVLNLSIFLSLCTLEMSFSVWKHTSVSQCLVGEDFCALRGSQPVHGAHTGETSADTGRHGGAECSSGAGRGGQRCLGTCRKIYS